jgi:hypothetical protein
MALQLPSTDDYCNTDPQGYRRFMYLEIDVSRKVIRARFDDYRDQAARNAGLKPFRETPYLVTDPAVFDDFVRNDNTNQAGIGAAVYSYVAALPENAGAINA